MRELNEIRLMNLISYCQLFSCQYGKGMGEFKPNSIRSIISSVDKHLESKKYGVSIINSKEDAFKMTRETLKAKQKYLKNVQREPSQ